MKFDAKAYTLRHPSLAAQVPELNARVRVSLPGLRPGERAEQALYASLSALGIAYISQYRWHPVRRWQSDAALPAHRLLVEIDGAVHRVHRDKWERDLEKSNAAQEAGWAILRFTPAQALDGMAALEVQRWLARVTP